VIGQFPLFLAERDYICSKVVDAVLLDFSKAYDKIPYQRLLTKLHHYAVCDNLLEWIRSFLSGRTQRVIVEGLFSQTAPVTSGVPPRNGPLLFLAEQYKQRTTPNSSRKTSTTNNNGNKTR
jgi:hypothetical protein